MEKNFRLGLEKDENHQLGLEKVTKRRRGQGLGLSGPHGQDLEIIKAQGLGILTQPRLRFNTRVNY